MSVTPMSHLLAALNVRTEARRTYREYVLHGDPGDTVKRAKINRVLEAAERGVLVARRGLMDDEMTQRVIDLAQDAMRAYEAENGSWPDSFGYAHWRSEQIDALINAVADTVAGYDEFVRAYDEQDQRDLAREDAEWQRAEDSRY